MTVVADTPATWRVRARGVDPVRLGLVTIIALGVLLRVYFLIVWHPALIGYPDGANYILAARSSLFGDPNHAAGYVLILRILHLIWPYLVLVTITQHVLGIAGGVLLYDAVRRARAPRALGLVPAAVVILGGSELMLEHAVLSDGIFIFLVALVLWCVVRAWRGSWWWAFAAGASIGVAIDVRTVGLELAPFVLVGLCLVPASELLARVTAELRHGKRFASALRLDGVLTRHPVLRWRAGALLAGLLGTVLLTTPYLVVHDASTGDFSFDSIGNLDLYGRVAPWADCSKFTPPAGTANLCISQPVSQRLGSQWWMFGSQSPVMRVYGMAVHPGENAKLQAFAVAAIEGEPFTYLKYVGRDLVRVVDPSFSESPNPAIGNSGASYSPQQNIDWYFNPSVTAGVETIVPSYYRGSKLHKGDVSLLKDWERGTRLEGPAMVFVLLLALLAPILTTGLPRRLAILFVLASCALIVGPILVVDYDYRYVISALGPLTAAASLGAFGLWRRVAGSGRRNRSSTDASHASSPTAATEI
jgi:hypothetical protein